MNKRGIYCYETLAQSRTMNKETAGIAVENTQFDDNNTSLTITERVIQHCP